MYLQAVAEIWRLNSTAGAKVCILTKPTHFSERSEICCIRSRYIHAACTPAKSQFWARGIWIFSARKWSVRRAKWPLTPGLQVLDRETRWRFGYCWAVVCESESGLGSTRYKPSSFFLLIYSQSHALRLHVMSDSRSSAVYFKMSGFCMCLNAASKTVGEPAEAYMRTSPIVAIVCVHQCVLHK